MTDPKVIVVVLRQPRRDDPREMRTDPLWEFASKFRSRRKPLPADIGRHVVASYHAFRQRGAPVARCYADSLPFPPPRIDQDRKGTYNALRAFSGQ